MGRRGRDSKSKEKVGLLLSEVAWKRRRSRKTSVTARCDLQRRGGADGRASAAEWGERR
jgi:hypothetical protein